MKYIGKYKIPEYAVCAIEYGDYTGLTDEEKREIIDFMSDNFPNGCVVDWHGNTPEGEAYFSTAPEFGLPTNVIDADFYEP